MRILLRKYMDKYYIWKDAKYDNGTYSIVENGSDVFIPQYNILAVTEDDRANYVVCANCGAVIKNDPESIEAHYAELEAKKNCFKCSELMPYGDENNVHFQYVKNADGTYHMTKQCDTKLGCGTYRYNTVGIDTEEAANRCQYLQCRKMGVQKVDDIFIKYPGLFNKQITVDLLRKRYLIGRSMSHNKEWNYNLGLRGDTLFAVANELGIVDHFIINHRYNSYIAYYSEKYDKLIFCDGNRYSDELPYGISQAKHDSAKKIIKALYKEA